MSDVTPPPAPIPAPPPPARALLDPQWLAGRGRLAQSIRLEEQGPGRFALVAIFALTLALVGFVAWSSLTTLGEVASASGEIVPVGSVKKVQHLEGGIVASLGAKDGDAVEEGQVLMTLQNGASGPELQQLRTRLAALKLQEQRLVALGEGGDSVTSSQARFDGLAATQSALLRDKQLAFGSQRAVLKQQVQQRKAELAAIQAQLAPTREQAAILNRQVASRSELVERGYSSRMGLMDQQREQARSRSQLAELEGQARRAQEAVVEAEARVQELGDGFRLEAGQELAKVRNDVAELTEAIAQSEDRVARLTIRAPVHGIVKGMQTETVGGVIAPGSTICEVIPTDAEMMVEARVLTRDIGFVRAGQPATVKVTTYDYTRYGGIDGKIETVSATTFLDERTVTPFYKVRIRLGSDHVGPDRDAGRVLPGMTVLADIRTGEKSVLAYLLQPIAHATGEAMRER